MVIFELTKVRGVFGNSWLGTTLKCINHGLSISMMLVYGLNVILRGDIDLTWIEKISMSVQPKSGDVYAIGIQGARCFAARNSLGSFILTCYNWQFTFWWAK